MAHFIITSHGWSASNWLAYLLNSHPSIICTHSARNILADDKLMQSNENLRKNLHSLHKGYLNRSAQSLDDSYDLIEQFGEAEWHGSVHVFRLRDLSPLHENFGPSRRHFNVLNLIRNPIDLVWSGYGQFRDLFRYDINELWWTLNKVMDAGRDFVIDLGLRHRLNTGELDYVAFFGACAVLKSLKLDFDAIEGVKAIDNYDFHGHVKMEEATSDPETLERLLVDLSGGVLAGEMPESMHQKFSEQVNKHRHDKEKLTARERYESWEPWQRECFDYFFGHFDLKAHYVAIGYDLDFLGQK